MRWPAAQLIRSRRVLADETGGSNHRSRRLLAFAAAELLLAMAIPFLAIEGYHTLLASRSGTLVDEPTRVDPGWTAVVSATPIIGVAETLNGQTSGLALIVPAGMTSDADLGGGSVVLVDATTAVPTPDGPINLASLEPSAALRTLAQSMKVTLSSAVVMDNEAWILALDGKTYDFDNPDPVPAVDGGDNNKTLAFSVGTVTVGGDAADVFVGRPVDAGSLSSLGLRRRLFWEAVIADPPSGSGRLAATLAELFVEGSGQVIDLPTQTAPSGPILEPDAAEELVRTIVAFPSGERLKMRLVDRTGSADLEAVAAVIAGRGIEVVEIANAAQFDDGATELIAPVELSVGRDQLVELAAGLGLEPLTDYEQDSTESVLLIGSDFDLDVLGWPGS